MLCLVVALQIVSKGPRGLQGLTEDWWQTTCTNSQPSHTKLLAIFVSTD